MHFSTTFLSCLCCAVLPEAVLVVWWVSFLSSTGYWWKWAHLVWLHPERIQRVLCEQWCDLGGFQASNWQSPEQPGLSLVLTLLWATGCAGNPWSFSTWWFYDLWLILFSLVSEEHLLAVVTRSCCLRTRFTQLKFMNCVNRKENRCGFFMQMLLLWPTADGEGLSEVRFIQEGEADAKQTCCWLLCRAEGLPSIWQQQAASETVQPQAWSKTSLP